ncbi:hypothetical protein E2C01_095349 [Portunus trituberculatus]|uniref:Uncharacterized protein n=1 Tax=Portunus trituberculatus TaxID=210409 RepID=A0A5B7K5J1_PORTR|nr:hypothetical protein [Portunus trituberculatus]
MLAAHLLTLPAHSPPRAVPTLPAQPPPTPRSSGFHRGVACDHGLFACN